MPSTISPVADNADNGAARRSVLAFTGGSTMAPFGVVVVAAGAAITKLRSRRAAAGPDVSDPTGDELGVSVDISIDEQERP